MRSIRRMCSDPFRVRYVCTELRKIGFVTVETQFSAHRFCCAPMMDGDDNPKKSIGYKSSCALRVQQETALRVKLRESVEAVAAPLSPNMSASSRSRMMLIARELSLKYSGSWVSYQDVASRFP
jgi:hypothetical protein